MSCLDTKFCVSVCNSLFQLVTGGGFFGQNVEIFIGSDVDGESLGTLCAYGPTSDRQSEYTIHCFNGAMSGRTITIQNRFTGSLKLCDVQVLGEHRLSSSSSLYLPNTHTPVIQYSFVLYCITALFSGNTEVSRTVGTRKVKPIWILLKQETVSGSGISWAICKSAPLSRQMTMPAPHHSVFYRPDALPAAQPTASKH